MAMASYQVREGCKDHNLRRSPGRNGCSVERSAACNCFFLRQMDPGELGWSRKCASFVRYHWPNLLIVWASLLMLPSPGRAFRRRPLLSPAEAAGAGKLRGSHPRPRSRTRRGGLCEEPPRSLLWGGENIYTNYLGHSCDARASPFSEDREAWRVIPAASPAHHL